jgi:hypothetical protein
MHQKINFPKFTNFVLWTVIASGVFLRLIKLSELFHFTYDEEIIAFVGKRIFVNHHLPLIGGVTPMHVHVAPYYYWISGFFLFLSRLNPVGWGIAGAAIAGVTMWVLYKVGTLYFNRKVGIVAVFLYAFSFYQNIFDRHYWGLLFDGLIALTTLLALYQILKGKKRYAWLLALSLTIGFHTDPSTLVLFLLTGLLFFFAKRNKLMTFSITTNTIKQTLLIISLVFLIALLPLVIFDIRHHFSNSRGIIQYLSELRNGRKGVIHTLPLDAVLFVPRVLARTLYVFGDTDLAKQYSYCPAYATGRLQAVPLTIVVGIFLLGLYSMIVYRKKSHYRLGLGIIGILFVATYVGITLYGLIAKGDLFDHYLSTLFPAFFLLIALVLVEISRRFLWLTILLLICFGIANASLLSHAQHRFGFADKEKAVRWAIVQTGSAPFSLDVLSDCFRFNGYRYLFYLFGKEPSKSYVDANFTHLYDIAPAQTHPTTLVIITNPDFKETPDYYAQYSRYLTKTKNRATFGNIEVLIVDNSQYQFMGDY